MQITPLLGTQRCLNAKSFNKLKFGVHFFVLKFIYSEKAAKFCEIFPLLLTIVHTYNWKGFHVESCTIFASKYYFVYLLKVQNNLKISFS